MISYSREFIFIHMNRCGGKSIEKALWNVDPMPGSSDHKGIIYWERELGKDTLKSFFTFTFCRNPFDRMVSLYGWHKKKEGTKTFRDFVFYIINEARYLAPKQISYISNARGVPEIDFVGRFENYESDWKKLCQELGIEKKLPHINASIHKNYKEYYFDENIVELVRQRYLEDILYFGYKENP